MQHPVPPPIQLVIFDKDGTLLDYNATWDRAVDDLLVWATNAPRFPDNWHRSAEAVGFDLSTRSATPGSPLIAETGAIVAELLYPWCDPDRISDRAALSELFARKGLEYATAMDGADDLLSAISDLGIPAVIATNDDEYAAKATVDAMGWERFIDWVVGADSGYGAKPDPGMVQAAVQRYGVHPRDAIMIGDTGHDVAAARAAGVRSVLLGDDSESWGADHVVADLAAVSALISPEI